VDTEGRLWICKKPKMTSIKVEGVEDKYRADLTEIITIPGKPKIKQAAFTRQRLFILTEKGDVYVIKI
jgi:hypothetical protein